MSRRNLVPIAFVVFAAAYASHLLAAPVTPYLEDFVSDAQDWIDGKTTGTLATWNASGGPDGSSYISVSMNTSTNATGSSRVVFRGNHIDPPTISAPTELHASDDKFYGDWLTGGVNHFSAWVFHEAPVELPYFVRIATAGNFPAIVLTDDALVQPNVWTKLDYILDSSYIGDTITVESGTTLEEKIEAYADILSLVERIQIGFNVPAAMAATMSPNPPNPVASTSFKYAIDQVAVYIGSIPEPSTACLLLVAAGLGLVYRRRSA